MVEGTQKTQEARKGIEGAIHYPKEAQVTRTAAGMDHEMKLISGADGTHNTHKAALWLLPTL